MVKESREQESLVWACCIFHEITIVLTKRHSCALLVFVPGAVECQGRFETRRCPAVYLRLLKGLAHGSGDREGLWQGLGRGVSASGHRPLHSAFRGAAVMGRERK